MYIKSPAIHSENNSTSTPSQPTWVQNVTRTCISRFLLDGVAGPRAVNWISFEGLRVSITRKTAPSTRFQQATWPPTVVSVSDRFMLLFTRLEFYEECLIIQVIHVAF